VNSISFPTTSYSDRSTTPTAIEEFEGTFGLQLPELFKQFLLATNGGRPRNPSFPISGLASNPIGDVNFFFGIAPQMDVYDLQKIFKRFVGRIPNDMVPTGENGGVDYICLDLRNGGERVVFWDHAHFWSTGEWRESDLYFIAGSFDEFLTSLRPNPY
jgi:SMI1-KNR4 cell-wall